MDAEEWRSQLVQAVAQQVRRRRLELGLSVQKLADICTEQYGLPIKRSVLANFEGGRRPALSVVELIVLARILAISPAELLFPVGREDQIEVLPDTSTDTWSALKWFTGESDRLPADEEASQDTTPIRLFRQHEGLLAELWRIRQEVDSILRTKGRADLRAFRTGPDPDGMADRILELKAQELRSTENALSLMRSQMRGLGLTPPPLGPEAAYIEPDSASASPQLDDTKGDNP